MKAIAMSGRGAGRRTRRAADGCACCRWMFKRVYNKKKCKKHVNLSDVYKKTGSEMERKLVKAGTYKLVDNVDKSVQNSIFPKKGKKWVCKTYPQNWGQNVDNVDNQLP